jgi:transposase
MALDALEDPSAPKGVFRRVGDRLGVTPETLCCWVRQTQVDAGQRAGVTTSDQERIKELEAENRELRRANSILKSASAFFAAEPGRPSR